MRSFASTNQNTSMPGVTATLKGSFMAPTQNLLLLFQCHDALRKVVVAECTLALQMLERTLLLTNGKTKSRGFALLLPELAMQGSSSSMCIAQVSLQTIASHARILEAVCKRFDLSIFPVEHGGEESEKLLRGATVALEIIHHTDQVLNWHLRAPKMPALRQINVGPLAC
jgi:hypothetical protein